MPYDEALADRIRDHFAGTPLLTEKKMFGGVGWMIGGHMAAGAHSDTALMIRCGKEDFEAYCADDGARAMERGGKPMSGWVLIAHDAVVDDAALTKWLERGKAHATSMPPKAAKPPKPRKTKPKKG